jgi:hypothetical protein
MERRKAMRFRKPTASPAVPEAKRYKVRLAALHAPRVFGAKLKAQLARGARTLTRGCLKIESESRSRSAMSHYPQSLSPGLRRGRRKCSPYQKDSLPDQSLALRGLAFLV